MTVGTQMQQVMAGIQSASASLKTFALQTEDKKAKQDFQSIAQSLDNALQTLEQRNKYIQSQEPQYKQQ
ncbi:DUF1657 domain-containing protein [Serpentinicella alkaliphila]|uniref:Uncharacterized protein DUF1657 n=1 Tax=Serpentinicella alkaliphila TaxID=1734049 RepID=A0A4R2TDH0_9FIRM|nr:DUF1657 domain-containing protein [Serpentinicella alkaliphila]QUH27015.1 DUF1657 domain-containing protein [Serpentinicella alkaliphila]TCQ01510.1 uncharacterized protein DUF1657 [Serpentinicella alkaliphila]